MSKAFAELLKAALQLNEQDRRELLEEIEESLMTEDEEYEFLTEEEFLAELNRRHEEARRDPSVMIPWEEVKRTLFQN